MNRRKYYELLDYPYFEVGIENDPDHIGLGFVAGCSSFRGDERDNFYIDLRFLTMTLEITLRELWELKERVKRYIRSWQTTYKEREDDRTRTQRKM